MRFSPGMTSSAARPRSRTDATGGDPDSTELRPRPESGPQSSNTPQRTAQPATDATSPSLPRVPADTTAGRFRIAVEQAAATVAATGEPAVLIVRVTNTSSIVDGYAVEALEAPAWLIVESDDVQLLPGTEEALSVRMRVVSSTLVPAQQLRLVLSIRSTSQAPAHLDLPVLVTVPVLDVPVGLRAEPRLLRVRDRDTAACTVLVDNSRSNRLARIRLSGSDPEQAVRFNFEHAALEVGPGESASVPLTVTAALPDPGQEISRILTVSALDGARTVETLITLQQARTVRVQDPPVTLEVVPSLVRVRDTTVGLARVVADNRGGTEWAHLELKASDPERLVRVTWASPQLHVPPGQTAHAEARFEAPLPDAGTEVSRTVTVTVMNGRQTSTATATFVQVASASPMATLAVRVEPSVVRVQDADGATVQVTIDNRRGRSGLRVFLTGNDAERAVRFTFSPPVVDLRPGEVRSVALRLDSWRPPPGQEWTRQFTVAAGDGHTTVDASGSLVQASSRAAIELLTLRLDPSVLRLPNRRRGQLTAVVDNRNGAQPVRVSLKGDDPENAVRFTFAPAVLEIPPGQVASSAVTIEAPRARPGGELTRPIAIMASDGRTEVKSDGSLIQSSAERRPLARVLFTLFGALAIFIGSMLPWLAVSDRNGFQLDAGTLAGVIGQDLDLLGFERLISVGLVVSGLAVLMLFGLAGRSGRLTRFSAVLAALVLIALFVGLGLVGRGTGPGSGALLVLTGCVLGYIGGVLVKR